MGSNPGRLSGAERIADLMSLPSVSRWLKVFLEKVYLPPATVHASRAEILHE